MFFICMDNTYDRDIVDSGNDATLPRRRDRLRAFVALKTQRKYLIVSLSALLLTCTALLAIAVDAESEPEAIPLGRGIAGVDRTLETGTAPIGQTLRAETEEIRRNLDAGGEQIAGGMASYYGDELAGNPTASGEAFNPEGLTAAHRTLPIGSKLKVTNARTGDSVIVRVNDRGPFHGRRVIDVSKAAAREIGLLKSGIGRVSLALLN